MWLYHNASKMLTAFSYCAANSTPAELLRLSFSSKNSKILFWESMCEGFLFVCFPRQTSLFVCPSVRRSARLLNVEVAVDPQAAPGLAVAPGHHP